MNESDGSDSCFEDVYEKDLDKDFAISEHSSENLANSDASMDLTKKILKVEVNSNIFQVSLDCLQEPAKVLNKQNLQYCKCGGILNY